jgi:hypothetical protein
VVAEEGGMEVIFVIRGFVMGSSPAWIQLRLRRSSFCRASNSCSRCQAKAVCIPNDWVVGEGNRIDNFLSLDSGSVG